VGWAAEHTIGSHQFEDHAIHITLDSAQALCPPLALWFQGDLFLEEFYRVVPEGIAATMPLQTARGRSGVSSDGGRETSA
jgi:hypothetical protein